MKNIIKAIADFQQDCPVILKDTSGYGYKYADLTQIDSVIKPLLAKHGLVIVQPLNGNTITTTIFHIESGEKIESVCNVPFESIKYVEKNGKTIILGFEGMNTAQAYGSLITYFRRYTISSLLGLITDKDTDGTGEKQPETTQQPKQTAQSTPPKTQTAPEQPQQKSEQQIRVELWAANKDEIENMVEKVTKASDLTIIKGTFPELVKHKPFYDLLTAKFNSLTAK